MTYPGQRPQCPSLFPHVLLRSFISQLNIVLCCPIMKVLILVFDLISLYNSGLFYSVHS